MQFSKKTILFVMLFMLAALPLFGCVKAEDDDSGAASSEDVVVLDADGFYKVALDYNAGTGFEWQCRVEPDGVVLIADQTTQGLSEDDTITGGPLREWVSVRPQKTGKATLICELVRPWEEDTPPAEVQTFVFEVDEELGMHFLAGESSYFFEPIENSNS